MVLVVKGNKLKRARGRGAPRGRPRQMVRLNKFARKVLSSHTYNFTRYAVNQGEISIPAGDDGYYPFTKAFQLADVVNYAEFSALFDQFRISKVDIKIQMLNNPDSVLAPNTVNTYYPIIWYVADYDDLDLPDIVTIKQIQGVKRKIMKPNTELKFSIRPQWKKIAYATSTGITGSSPSSGYISVLNANTVPWYGTKFLVDCHSVLPAGANPIKFNMEIKYHLSFKNPN